MEMNEFLTKLSLAKKKYAKLDSFDKPKYIECKAGIK
jgi:hypothetical protein